MQSLRAFVVTAAWLSLFLLQVSGLHAHTNENGFTGVPETGNSHVHSHRHDDHHRHPQPAGDEAPGKDDAAHSHDYEDSRDVSFFDLASGDTKSPSAVALLVFLFSVHEQRAGVAPNDFIHPVLSGRHARWRPPLRAPPHFANI